MSIEILLEAPDEIKVPCKKTVSVFGVEGTIILNVPVRVSDIWKWYEHYEHCENSIEPNTPKVVESKPKRKYTKKSSEEIPEKNSSESGAKISISRRLTGIENWKKGNKKSKFDLVSSLISTLKDLSPTILAEIVNCNLDRLNDVTKASDVSEELREDLRKVLDAAAP